MNCSRAAWTLTFCDWPLASELSGEQSAARTASSNTAAELKAELSGILNWALWGVAEYRADGLGEPDAVKAATAKYRDEMDVLAEFIAECCIVERNASAGATPLYTEFVKWCDRAGERPIKQKEFGVRLSERGFEIDRGAGGRSIRLGIGLLTSDDS